MSPHRITRPPSRLGLPRLLLPAGVALLAACFGNDGPTAPPELALTSNPYLTPQTRWFFIAAEEVPWNFAPSGFNQITGLPFDDGANVFVQGGRDRIGSEYIKALYREYTDASFTTLKPVAPEWGHLGTLGPVIRGVVGDTFKIVFRNQTAFPFSMHPHGVFYDKDSEGAGYDDGTTGGDKDDDAVPPGGTHLYTWLVPSRAGPGPGDPSSILWIYHSHVDESKDTNAGLVGPIIVMEPGTADPSGRPSDVDREFVTLFTIFDENVSHYLDRNIQEYAGVPTSVHPEDEAFEESNLMHSINGFLFGNMPLSTMTMTKGERVRWYVMGMGTEVDIHTPHWHGQTGLHQRMRTDILEIFPASMKVLDMEPDNPGVWLFHCHVNDHIDAGMLTRFEVLP